MRDFCKFRGLGDVYIRQVQYSKMNFGKHVVFPKFNLVYYTVTGPRNEFWKNDVFLKFIGQGKTQKHQNLQIY